MEFEGVAETVKRVGRVMEGVEVAIIVAGAAIATVLFLSRMRRGGPVDDAYTQDRRGLGRAILLGLEFLVAGTSAVLWRSSRRSAASASWRSSSPSGRS